MAIGTIFLQVLEPHHRAGRGAAGFWLAAAAAAAALGAAALGGAVASAT